MYSLGYEYTGIHTYTYTVDGPVSEVLTSYSHPCTQDSKSKLTALWNENVASPLPPPEPVSSLGEMGEGGDGG